MKNILSWLKEKCWKTEFLFMIIGVALLTCGLIKFFTSSISLISVWLLVWYIDFASIFIADYININNKVKKQLVRFILSIVLAILTVIALIIYIQEKNVPGIITISLCSILMIVNVIPYWMLYKYEKYLTTKCQGHSSNPNCDKETEICFRCPEYREYISPEKLHAIIKKTEKKCIRRQKVKKLLNKFKKNKKTLF